MLIRRHDKWADDAAKIKFEFGNLVKLENEHMLNRKSFEINHIDSTRVLTFCQTKLFHSFVSFDILSKTDKNRLNSVSKFLSKNEMFVHSNARRFIEN